jgi:hypothetical protein
MYEEEQRFNKSKKGEMVPRYISTSLPYYQKVCENEEFEQRAQNLELPICYVVEQKAINSRHQNVQRS